MISSSMRRELRECRARMSNAIEAYHRTVYRVLRKNEQSAPVFSALPVLLQLVKDDIRLLGRFFNRGELPTYDPTNQAQLLCTMNKII